MGVTALAILGMLLIGRFAFDRDLSVFNGALILSLAVLIIILTVLIFYPFGKSQLQTAAAVSQKLGESESEAKWRAFGIFLMLVVLFPFAFFVVFIVVCNVGVIILAAP
jgi:hypothetical protein